MLSMTLEVSLLDDWLHFPTSSLYVGMRAQYSLLQDIEENIRLTFVSHGILQILKEPTGSHCVLFPVVMQLHETAGLPITLTFSHSWGDMHRLTSCRFFTIVKVLMSPLRTENETSVSSVQGSIIHSTSIKHLQFSSYLCKELWGKFCNYSHFLDEGTSAQRHFVTHSRPRSIAKPGPLP